MTDQHRAIPDRVSFLDVVLARLEAIFMSLTEPPYCAQHINYLEPAGDPGIFGPTLVTWRVLSNPVSVFIGGITGDIRVSRKRDLVTKERSTQCRKEKSANEPIGLPKTF